MKICNIVIINAITLISISCVSLEKITRHDFDSGYFKLKTPGSVTSEIYAESFTDSIALYQVKGAGKSKIPDNSSAQGIKFSDIKPGSFLYKSTLVRSSLDFDLSTIITKYRPAASGVPNQLSSNINAALYLGIRRDYFILKSHVSPLKAVRTNMRQIGFDAGVFAGMGITPINPTVTNSIVPLEYDGMVFQKGVGVFFTIEHASLGVAIGFDNLMDKNSGAWIYNQKPWIGLVLGIANF